MCWKFFLWIAAAIICTAIMTFQGYVAKGYLPAATFLGAVMAAYYAGTHAGEPTEDDGPDDDDDTGGDDVPTPDDARELTYV